MQLKQPALKPQDLVIALKIAASESRQLTFSGLAAELQMAVSQVHSATQRAITSHLIMREYSGYVANRRALSEFIIHGIRYAFPFVTGEPTRGLLTGGSAPPFAAYFQNSEGLPLVWPDQHGSARGISVLPLHPMVPAASRADEKLYYLLAIVDAIRGGAAREREIGKSILAKALM